MPSLVVVVPGSIETRTGGYGYDRRIAAGLRKAGWDVEIVGLDPSFPIPTPAAREGASRALACIPDGTAVLVDGLALGALPLETERERDRLRLIALVHHPLARETGLDPSVAAALEESERRALAAVRRVVVTSEETARALADYGVTRDRIAVVEPGTDPAPPAKGSGGEGVLLLCVASIVPRKGHDVLIRALARVRALPWTLTLVGSDERDVETAARVRRLIRDSGLDDRVRFAGELEGEALDRAYDTADVFVLPTRYEGYGMVVAEALARGLPVVSTKTGAIEPLVDGAGLLVPPGDEDALAGALSRVLSDAELRRTLARRARAAGARLADWDDASRRMAEVVSVEFQR